MITIIVIGIARFVGIVSKLVGKGSGSAAPGLVVEKLKPNLIKRLNKLPLGTVLITGTNGKTTTTKMVVEMLEARGQKVLTNKSGSNFTRGILSMLVKHMNWRGVLDYDIAVLEMDEAYTKIIAKAVPPKLVVALNVHRDQLDRYGEIDNTAKMIGESMQYAESVVVNADDPALVKVTKKYAKDANLVYFGAVDKLQKLLPTDDDLHGSRASRARRPKADVMLTEYNGRTISLKTATNPHNTAFSLPGIYNAVNAAAAVAAVRTVLKDEDSKNIVRTLAQLKPAFGRGERFVVGNKKLLFGLVKNPAGFNHNIRTMLKGKDVVVIAINDDYADGRDVSWLWDVHFDQVKRQLNNKYIAVTGVRADDMARRLSQEDIKVNVVEKNSDELLENLLRDKSVGENVVIFPTYTAMLSIRKFLSKKIEVPDIW